MLDLRSADAVGERSERAVRRGMAVAAHDRCAGQCKTLLRADDVDDALAPVEFVEILDAEILGILRQRLDLDARFLVGDAVTAVGGRHVVIDDGERLSWRAHLAASHAQTFERLRARHLVDEMPVDVEHAGAIRLTVDDVVVEDLVVEGLGHVAGLQQKRLCLS